MNHTLKKSLVFAVIFILLCSLVPLTLLLSSNKNNRRKNNENNPANEDKVKFNDIELFTYKDTEIADVE